MYIFNVYIYIYICLHVHILYIYIYIYKYIHIYMYSYIKINRLTRMCIQSSRPQSGPIISKAGRLYVHRFDNRHVEISTEPDQTSTKFRHPQCRSLFGICMNHAVNVRMSTKLRYQTAIPNFGQTSSKLRPNFDAGVGVSRFGRSSDQTSTPQCRSLVETSTRFRHWGVEVWSGFRPNFGMIVSSVIVEHCDK